MVEGGWKEAGIRARCPLSRIRELGSKGAKQVCLGILNGTLPGLQTLFFLAYKGIRESNWGSPASFCPLVGTESNSEPRDYLLPVLPPGGLLVADFIFHPRAREIWSKTNLNELNPSKVIFPSNL